MPRLQLRINNNPEKDVLDYGKLEYDHDVTDFATFERYVIDSPDFVTAEGKTAQRSWFATFTSAPIGAEPRKYAMNYDGTDNDKPTDVYYSIVAD